MDRKTFETIERFMLTCMTDAAHDKEHIYRVLYAALEIAGTETGVDADVLIAACLLHDVGREAQFRDPSLCHAEVGSGMAYDFLRGLGWDEHRAGWVRDCVLTHRTRTDRRPQTLEARILFDADKLDVTGAMGVARTLIYGGEIGQALYQLDGAGRVLTAPDTPPSFFREFNYKLRTLYDGFYTRRAREMAEERKAAAVAFYEALLGEVQGCYEGRGALEALLGSR